MSKASPTVSPVALTPEVALRGTEARVRECLAAKAYGCAIDSLRVGRAIDRSQSSRELQAEVASAVKAEAKRFEREVKRTTGSERTATAAAAAALWQLWSEAAGRPAPGSAREMERIATSEPRPARAAVASEGKRAARPESDPTPAYRCCKHCTKGRPCGDSCISCSKVCRKGRGCAC